MTRSTVLRHDVIVVEDDESLRSALVEVLSHDGVAVDAMTSAEQLLERFTSEAVQTAPDLVILDVGLPGIDGIEACRRLRSFGHGGAILMLTARHTVNDRVLGLDAGADDYLVKPFALAELRARVRAHLRRAHAAPDISDARIRVADLEIDTDTRVVERAGRPVELTRLEFDLLALLATNSPRVQTREVIHDRVWGHDGTYGSNSLEVAISQLRRKVDPDASRRLIHTVRGVGYVIREP